MFHPQSGSGGPNGIVLLPMGGKKDGHDGIADEFFNTSSVSFDNLFHFGQVGIQEVDHLFGRMLFGKGGKTANI